MRLRWGTSQIRDQCIASIQHHLQAVPGITQRVEIAEGVPSLIATPDRHPEPDLIFLAHMDTVEHANPEHYTATVESGRIVGPGAGDMKGQVAILLELFIHTHLHHPDCSLGLVITTDEEVGGKYGAGHLFPNGIVCCKQVINPDGGAPNRITVGEKGVMHLGISCTGSACHAARPWKGSNAVEDLLAVLDRVKGAIAPLQTENDHWHPTCSITRLACDNQSINRIPPRAEAAIDVRFPHPHTLASIREVIDTAIAGQATIRDHMTAEPADLNPDPLFVQCCEERYGSPPTLVRDDGASDSRFVAAAGIPVIMSRPLVGNLHSRDEWIDIDSMVTFYHVLECYVTRRLKLAKRR